MFVNLIPTIKLRREYGRDFDCDLCDLSNPMLRKAKERLAAETRGAIRIFQGDIRHLPLPEVGYDVILAAAVLHHLRGTRTGKRPSASCFRCSVPAVRSGLPTSFGMRTMPSRN